MQLPFGEFQDGPGIGDRAGHVGEEFTAIPTASVRLIATAPQVVQQRGGVIVADVGNTAPESIEVHLWASKEVASGHLVQAFYPPGAPAHASIPFLGMGVERRCFAPLADDSFDDKGRSQAS